MSCYKSILAIPDQHININSNLRRFEALGNLVVERKPDYIVNGGDMVEMSCLYGIHGKKSWSFRPETADVVESELQRARLANELLFNETFNLANRRISQKKRPYWPITHYCFGNHDHRAVLYWNMNRGEFNERTNQTLNEWLGFDEYWDNVHDFQKPIEIEGIVFSHHYTNGTAVASTVDTIGKLTAQSAVGFHSHKLEFKATKSVTNRPVYCMQGGWFSDPDDPTPEWATGGNDWYNCVVILNGVTGKGHFEPEVISTERLIKEYL